MFKKLKSLAAAVLTAAVFPVFRIPGNDDPDTDAGSREKTNDRTAEGSSQAGMPVPPEQGVEKLKGLLADKETELDRAKEKIAGLEKAAGETAARLNELDGSLKKTVAGYKALVLQSNPEILPELVTGDTMEALDNSLSRARDLTGKIKEGLQAQARSQKVPAGAPVRGREDTSGLSPRDKIREGIGRK